MCRVVTVVGASVVVAVFGTGCGNDSRRPDAAGVAPRAVADTSRTEPADVQEATAASATPAVPANGAAAGNGVGAGSDASPPLTPPPEPTGSAAADSESERVAAALDAAEADFEDDKPDEALKKIEASIKADGVARRGLLLKARILESQGRELIHSDPKRAVELYEKCVATYRQAEEKFADLERFEKVQWATAHYDLACSLALAGDAKKALESLAMAHKGGFNDLEHYESDADLESLRTMPEYVAFIAEKREEAKDRIRTAFAEFRPIDVEFEATALDGTKISVEELKGKAIIVDCWATWCPPCRKMLPVLAETHRKFQEKGLLVVGVNFEQEKGDEAKATIEEFLEKHPLPYPCVVDGAAIQPKLPFFSGIPTCFYIDRAGKIRYRTTGARSQAEVETIVELLLNAKEVPTIREN